MTPHVKRKLYSTQFYGERLKRKFSPLRGFLVAYQGNDVRPGNLYQSLLRKLFKYIDQLDSPNKESGRIGETFQSTQKGTTAPISPRDVLATIENIVAKKDITLSDEIKQKFENYRDILIKYFRQFGTFDPHKIDFQAEWKKLPNTTLRGLPYLDKGEKVDELIFAEAGNTFSDALAFMKRSDELSVYLGGRVQGSDIAKPAKVRGIMVPSVFYQYINVGLYKQTMDIMKKATNFAGGQEPEERYRTITGILLRAKRNRQKSIPLDYSKFDQHIHPFFRKLANDVMVGLATDPSVLKEYKEQQDKLNANQQLGIYEGNKLVKKPLMNQLLSGVINTQQDGSIINIMFQMFIRESLGLPFTPEDSLALGDDTGLLLPEYLVDGAKYQDTLKLVNDILGKVGAQSHTTKAYPTTQLTFLQKLGDLDNNIMSAGTGARTMTSFIFKERFTNSVKGIESLPALEILGQISLLNEAFTFHGDTSMNDFAKIFVEEWLRLDDGLMGVINKLRSTNSLTEDRLFNYLTELAHMSKEDLLRFLDKQTYDHTFLSDKLETFKSYKDIFPVLKYLVNSTYTRPIDDQVGVDLMHIKPTKVSNDDDLGDT